MTSFACFAAIVLEIDFVAYQSRSHASELGPVYFDQMHIWMVNTGGCELDQSLFVLGVGLDSMPFVGYIIHKQVLPQIIGSGEEDTTFAGFCHLHNKSAR